MHYFNLLENPIDQDTWNVILEREKQAQYFSYNTYKGTKTDLSFADAYITKENKSNPFDPLNLLLDKFNSKLVMHEDKTVAFIKFNAGGGIFPHIDDHLKHSTIFSWAVNTDPKNFEPIAYHDENNFDVIEKAYYSAEGLVFTTQKYHSVQPSILPRISLQVCFYNPIEEVYNLYTKGELFNGMA